MTSGPVLARSPGRIRLMGEDVDGSATVLSMAIDRSLAIEMDRSGYWVELVSTTEPDAALIPTDVVNPAGGRPVWARYAAAAIAIVQPEEGGNGFITSNIPVDAAMGSSTALTVAACLALGGPQAPDDLALIAQQAEQLATGEFAPLSDALTMTAAVAGHALLVDGLTLEHRLIPFPDHLEVLVVPAGIQRELALRTYSVRRMQCEEAAELLGSLRTATLAEVEGLADEALRRRARHVVTEAARVEAFAAALEAGNARSAGELMRESQRSLREDFEVGSAAIDDVIDVFEETPGVYGARLTGAGAAGAVIALAERGADPDVPGVWRVRPAGPATFGAARP